MPRFGAPRDIAALALPYAPLALATVVLAFSACGAVIEAAGGPAAPLDDTYIHFQYARSIAELHPFRYTAGAEPTPGATSLLWPLILAPFHAIGFRGAALAYPAWLLGFGCLALLAVETRRLALGLVSPATATAAGAMVVAFGGFTWFAASGMEVVPFAWLLARAAVKTSEWVEADHAERTRARYRELVALAVVCPLMRPEGALAALVAAAVLVVCPGPRGRAGALPALLAPLAPSALCLVATGQATLSTAVAKWLPLNPYFAGGRLTSAVLGHVGLLFGTLLDGRLWTSIFIPSGGRAIAVLALVAVPIVARRERRTARGLVVLALAAGMLVPTTYETFLVNRVRYVWPFAAGYFVALAALSELAGAVLDTAAERLGAKKPGAAPAIAFTLVGLFAAKVPASIDDVAASSQAISLQQVSLARWAKEALPPDARLGVNDTGALAYFSDHATFDVVGLTTRGEARYWTAGPGSRFEHYERLDRRRLPTHFVVYPEWFGLSPLLGQELASRTVHHTILGGATMAAHEARYGALGSGEAPSDSALAGRTPIDVLDVADLESEAAHGYALFDAVQLENRVVEDGERADGGRADRTRDAFTLRVAPGGLLVLRCGSEARTVLEFTVAGVALPPAVIAPAEWQEIAVRLPGSVAAAPATVDVRASGAGFTALHYWSYE